MLDGEVVAFKGRRTSFERLQGRIGLTDPEKARATGIAVFYYVFDLMHLDGSSTTDLPLTWRKKLLRNSFEFAGPLRLSTHRVTDGEAAFRPHASVATRASSPSWPTRSMKRADRETG